MDIEEEIKELRKMISDLNTTVAIINQEAITDRDMLSELKSEMKQLTIALNRVSLLIGKKQGVEEGTTNVMKWVWTIFGALIVGWIIWISTTVLADHIDIERIITKGH